jgi:hypothetical protein
VILHIGDISSDPTGPAPIALIQPYQSDRQSLLRIVCTVERDPATLIDRDGANRNPTAIIFAGSFIDGANWDPTAIIFAGSFIDGANWNPTAIIVTGSFMDGANWDPTASMVAGVKLGLSGLTIAVAHREGIQRMIYVYG